MLKKLFLVTVTACFCNITNVGSVENSTSNKQAPTNSNNFDIRVKTLHNNYMKFKNKYKVDSDEYNERFQKEMFFQLKEYYKLNIITDDINKNLYDVWSKRPVPSDMYLFIHTEYEAIILQLLINIIEKFTIYYNSNDKADIMPKCICNTKLPLSVLNEIKYSSQNNNKTVDVLYSEGYNNIFVEKRYINYNSSKLQENITKECPIDILSQFGTYLPLTNGTNENLTDKQLNDLLKLLLNIRNIQFGNKSYQFKKLINDKTFLKLHCSLLTNNKQVNKLVNVIKNSHYTDEKKLSILNVLADFYEYQVERSKLWSIHNMRCFSDTQITELYNAYKKVYDLLCEEKQQLSDIVSARYQAEIEEIGKQINEENELNKEVDGFEIIDNMK